MGRTSAEHECPRPFISVIVPVRNEAQFLGTTLKQLLGQKYSPSCYEVLVADGESSDGTTEIVRAFAETHANLRLVRNKRVWSSAGRNEALSVARGEIIVIVDGHCEIGSEHYLEELADAFERSGADCIGRPQPLDVASASPLQEAIALARSSVLGHHPDSFIYSAEERFVSPHSVAVAYRRSVFERIGLFDESFDACEDVEFNHRLASAGLRCFFTPRVAVQYYPRATLKALFCQMARYGRGRVRLLRKYPETFGVLGFTPALFVLGITVGGVLALISSPVQVLYFSAVGLYAAIIAATTLLLGIRRNRLSLLRWVPLVFVTIHAGAGVGILAEFLGIRAARRMSPVDK